MKYRSEGVGLEARYPRKVGFSTPLKLGSPVEIVENQDKAVLSAIPNTPICASLSPFSPLQES